VLRVFVRNVDYDNMQLAHGVRVFVAEAYHPAHAPPAVVDPVLQVGLLLFQSVYGNSLHIIAVSALQCM
jgi:hypothetical protein